MYLSLVEAQFLRALLLVNLQFHIAGSLHVFQHSSLQYKIQVTWVDDVQYSLHYAQMYTSKLCAGNSFIYLFCFQTSKTVMCLCANACELSHYTRHAHSHPIIPRNIKGPNTLTISVKCHSISYSLYHCVTFFSAALFLSGGAFLLCFPVHFLCSSLLPLLSLRNLSIP